MTAKATMRSAATPLSAPLTLGLILLAIIFILPL
jgi:hypothetical protein